MAHADYQTALKNGIDAARSGSRMMARLHLLKAADLVPDDVAAHLWLAWVAETPADALAHLDEALARQPEHGLTRLGRLWTQFMSEYDIAKDYSHCDLGELVGGAEHVGQSASHAANDVARTQRLSGLTHVERRDSKSHHATQPTDSPALAPSRTHEPTPKQTNEPFDLTRTVRMDLLRRERPEDVDEPSPALTCLIPSKPPIVSSDKAAEDSQPAPPSDAQMPTEEAPSSGTIRIDSNAVKRALAESVIAEMTSPDHNGHAAEDVVVADAAEANTGTIDPTEPVAADAAGTDQARAAPRVDEYTEPPQAALSPDAPEGAAANRSGATSTGPRVLVVDDSPTVRKLVTATLEAQGYRVACAASGYEAVEVLAQAMPDALVIEVDLPRLDGLHLCKLLRSQDATRQTPVIFLTRRSGTMDRMRGKLVGATAYLTKPFRSVSLIEEMSACCPAVAK